MPSAQNADAQSAFLAQLAPFIFLPQLALTHCWPATHWLDSEHAPKHAPLVASHE